MSIDTWREFSDPVAYRDTWKAQVELDRQDIDALRDRLRDTAETLRIFCEAHDEMYVSGEPCHIYNDARAILNRLKEEGLA